MIIAFLEIAIIHVQSPASYIPIKDIFSYFPTSHKPDSIITKKIVTPFIYDMFLQIVYVNGLKKYIFKNILRYD